MLPSVIGKAEAISLNGASVCMRVHMILMHKVRRERPERPDDRENHQSQARFDQAVARRRRVAFVRASLAPATSIGVSQVRLHNLSLRVITTAIGVAIMQRTSRLVAALQLVAKGPKAYP